MFRFISRKYKLIDWQSSRNARELKEFLFFRLCKFPPEVYEFFKLGAREFHFSKFKKKRNFQGRFFIYFLSSKSFLWNFFTVRARNFCFPKYKENFF